MAKRRAWTPPAKSAHVGSPAASLAQYGIAANEKWSSNPALHIILFRPRCSAPGCREPSMVWGRCRCRATFGSCHDHEPTVPVQALRAAHMETHAPIVR